MERKWSLACGAAGFNMECCYASLSLTSINYEASYQLRTNIRKPTTDYAAEEYARLFATNFEPAYHLCQLAHPLLKASENGSVVFISSVAGLVHLSSGSIYGAIKGVMNQLTRNLACEWAKDEIQVLMVLPRGI